MLVSQKGGLLGNGKLVLIQVTLPVLGTTSYRVQYVGVVKVAIPLEIELRVARIQTLELPVEVLERYVSLLLAQSFPSDCPSMTDSNPSTDFWSSIRYKR